MKEDYQKIRSDTGPFSIVPEWVIVAPISHGAVRLYSLLARYADYSTGEAFPSRTTLASRLRISTDPVDRFIKELVGIGALEVVKRFNGSQWQSNLYILRRIDPSLDIAPSLTGEATPSRDITPRGSRDIKALTRTIQQEPDKQEVCDVEIIFAKWLISTNKDPSRTKLDTKRLKAIEWALANYSFDDVVDAINGWKKSPFHSGDNAQRKVYNDLTLILRNAERLEFFRDCERLPREQVIPKAWHKLKLIMGEDDE